MTQLSKDFQMVAVGAVGHDERIEKFEAELKSMREQLANAVASNKFGKANKNDPGFTKIAFLGFPAGLCRELCIREMRKHAEAKIPLDGQGDLSYRIVDCDVFYKKGADGKQESTGSGYMQFGHRNARDAVM